MSQDSKSGPLYIPIAVAAIGAVATIAVALIQFIGRPAPPTTPTAAPSTPSPILPASIDSDLVAVEFVAPSNWITGPEVSVDRSWDQRFGNGANMIRLDKVEYGPLPDSRGVRLELVITNITDQPIRLEVTDAFFVLEDAYGQPARLRHFCCRADGDLLNAGGERRARLVFEDRPSSSPTTPRPTTDSGCFKCGGPDPTMLLRVRGFLPIVLAEWRIRPPATAN